MTDKRREELEEIMASFLTSSANVDELSLLVSELVTNEDLCTHVRSVFTVVKTTLEKIPVDNRATVLVNILATSLIGDEMSFGKFSDIYNNAIIQSAKKYSDVSRTLTYIEELGYSGTLDFNVDTFEIDDIYNRDLNTGKYSYSAIASEDDIAIIEKHLPTLLLHVESDKKFLTVPIDAVDEKEETNK